MTHKIQGVIHFLKKTLARSKRIPNYQIRASQEQIAAYCELLREFGELPNEQEEIDPYESRYEEDTDWARDRAEERRQENLNLNWQIAGRPMKTAYPKIKAQTRRWKLKLSHYVAPNDCPY